MRTKRRKLSSKQLFDHLQEELAMKRCSPQVQRAMRKWAAREYLYPVEPLLTAEEQRLVEKHGAFQHHIKQEMDNLLEDEVKLICVEIAYEKQFFSYEADSILPWFLRLSRAELKGKWREHETVNPGSSETQHKTVADEPRTTRNNLGRPLSRTNTSFDLR